MIPTGAILIPNAVAWPESRPKYQSTGELRLRVPIVVNPLPPVEDFSASCSALESFSDHSTSRQAT